MSVYDKNLQVLKEKDQVLYKAVLDWKEPMEEHCFVQETRNGAWILGIERDDRNYYMGSRYNPEQEAERFAGQYRSLVNESYMIYLGFGDGRIARSVIANKGDRVQYLFYEPSSDIFLYVLHHFDISDILENDRVRIMVKGMGNKVLDVEIGKGITDENFRWCILDALPLYKQLFAEDYDIVKQKYSFLVSLVAANLTTAGYFGKEEARNNILNMKELFHSNCEEDFEGVFPTDRPAIVVAAGPSLEKNVQYLKRAKGKMMIIAVDTALRYLVSQGVQPDLAVVADPKKPVRLFEEDAVRKIPLALCSSANNEIICMMQDEKLVFVSAEGAYFEKMYQIAGKHMYTLSGGGSVATFAFVLARAWGYSKIVLVGQDLALAPDKVHAGKDDVDLYKLKQNKIEIEGYYGDKVYTSRDYNFYREWYEMIIPRKIGDLELEVINATEGGAKIKGATQMTLKEVIDSCDAESFDFEGTIRNMPCTFNGKQKQEVVNMWKESIAHIEELRDKLQDGMQETCGITDAIQNNAPFDFVKAQKKIKKVIEDCNSYEEIFFIDVLVSQNYKNIIIDILDSKDDNSEECVRLLNKQKEYMNQMYDAASTVKEWFVELVDSVKGDE